MIMGNEIQEKLSSDFSINYIKVYLYKCLNYLLLLIFSYYLIIIYLVEKDNFILRYYLDRKIILK